MARGFIPLQLHMIPISFYFSRTDSKKYEENGKDVDLFPKYGFMTFNAISILN